MRAKTLALVGLMALGMAAHGLLAGPVAMPATRSHWEFLGAWTDVTRDPNFRHVLIIASSGRADHGGPLSVQMTNLWTGPCRVENVRLEGVTLSFTLYVDNPAPTHAVQYELRLAEPGSISARTMTAGSNDYGQVTWRRMVAPEGEATTPTLPSPSIPQPTPTTGFTPQPPAQDPLGLAGTWIEYWPGINEHDLNVITFQNGQYTIQSANPRTGQYRIENVRLKGSVLRFTQYPGGNAVLQYEVQARDANTLVARVAGGPRGGDAIVWQRQNAPAAPVIPQPSAPFLAPVLNTTPMQPSGSRAGFDLFQKPSLEQGLDAGSLFKGPARAGR